MTDIFSYLQTDATRFATKTGVTGGFGPLTSGVTAPANTLILQPFFVGTDGLTLTACGLLCTGGSGTNIAQFGVYDVSPSLARDVYPKNLVAEANAATYSATGVVWSSGWVGGAPAITLQNGLYYVAVLVGGVGTRTFGSNPTYSDASFWLGFEPVSRNPYSGFHAPHTAGTALPASFPSFPAVASLFTPSDAQRIFVGMR